MTFMQHALYRLSTSNYYVTTYQQRNVGQNQQVILPVACGHVLLPHQRMPRIRGQGVICVEGDVLVAHELPKQKRRRRKTMIRRTVAVSMVAS